MATHDVDLPYHPERATTLVVGCCDGRYLRAMERFLKRRGIDLHDLVTMPGGPARLCFETAPFLEYQDTLEAIELMVDLHGTRRIVLIAHADCAYYVKRHGTSEMPRQCDDLAAAASLLRSRLPQVDVDLYYLRPHRGSFAVDEVPPPAEVV